MLLPSWVAYTALLVVVGHPLGAMPLYFVHTTETRSAAADFTLATKEMTVQFRQREVVYSMPGSSAIAVRFLSAQSVHAEGFEPLPGKIHVFDGPRNSSFDTFSSVGFRGLWPGVDAVYSASDHLKTEFRLAPGADPQRVAWQIMGADWIEHAGDGALVIHSGDRELREEAPQVFEEDRITGVRKPVSGAFRLISENTVGIAIGPYDHANRLIFDPVIGFSTYLDGSGQTVATGVALDSSGNVIVAGYTTTFDIATGATTFGVPQRTGAFVAKLSATGNQLMFLTYIGGTLDTRAFAVAVDRFNNIYITGQTSANNFPTYKAVQPAINGAQDAFVTELNSTGAQMVFSTYLGGSSAEQGYGIGVDRTGDIYVAGDTVSVNFPMVKAVQPAIGGGQDAFLVKLAPSGVAVIFSTYMGGREDEHAAALTVDSSDAAIVAGWTESSNFPVVNAFQPQSGGNQDAFVFKMNPAGAALTFSSYLGGSGGTPGLTESAAGLAVDSSNAIYIAGSTSSLNFPTTPGAFATPNPDGTVGAFAVKLTAAGAMVYSTCLGGSSVSFGLGVAVDIAGNSHITGYTGSSDFPMVRDLQPALSGEYDLFLTKLNSTGSGLIYSTLLGGSAMDESNAIAVDKYGTVFLAGQTNSTNFPVLNAYQTTQHGIGAALAVRIPVGWKPMVFTSSGAANWAFDDVPFAQTQNFTFGHPGDIAIVGDWTGKGYQCMGTFNAGAWYLDENCDGVIDSGDRTFVFGQPGDVPVVGDWTGSGTAKAGLYRAGTFILDLSGHLSGIPTGVKDAQFAFGLATDIPVAGDWNNTGYSKAGVFRNGEWLLDTNGSYTVNGPTRNYGEAGDLPVTGDWDGSGTLKAGVYRAGSFLLDYDGNWIINSAGDITLPWTLTAAGQIAQEAFVMH
jgi:hypothetical protein